MSMMGELKFFCGPQVHQSPCGIFISQSQYVIMLLKKHEMDECDSMSTPIATARLDANLQGTPTNQTKYRSMIGGHMYLTASRPDIAFATFESGFELIAYLDADHTGCHDEYKSTPGGLQFLGEKLVSWSSKKGTVELYFVVTEYQLAYLFTKVLPKEHFEYLVHRIEFIMAQQQQIDVPQDKLCPPNKRFDFMDENKKFDILNPQCPNEIKILTDIVNNHPLRTCVAASMSELTMTVADFRRIFRLPQATENNHVGFFDAPTFSQTISFYHNALGFLLTLRSPSNFVSKGLPQPWQTLIILLSYVSNNFDSLPFTKIIIDHYITENLDISRRVHDNYHRVENDDLVKKHLQLWEE
ncbi:hypothetical protein Tco_1284738 [Tanacetum coccineum]